MNATDPLETFDKVTYDTTDDIERARALAAKNHAWFLARRAQRKGNR